MSADAAPRDGLVTDRDELMRRARRIALVLTDADGVLTDASVWVDDRGNEFKRFNVRDGMGFERLINAGIRCAIVSGEANGCFARRAEKLGARAYLGVRDKLALASRILDDHGVASLESVAFIGDDVNDRTLLHAVATVGLAATPRDGERSLGPLVQLRCSADGGQGAFREFAEWLLALRTADDGRPR